MEKEECKCSNCKSYEKNGEYCENGHFYCEYCYYSHARFNINDGDEVKEEYCDVCICNKKMKKEINTKKRKYGENILNEFKRYFSKNCEMHKKIKLLVDCYDETQTLEESKITLINSDKIIFKKNIDKIQKIGFDLNLKFN